MIWHPQDQVDFCPVFFSHVELCSMWPKWSGFFLSFTTKYIYNSWYIILACLLPPHHQPTAQKDPWLWDLWCPCWVGTSITFSVGHIFKRQCPFGVPGGYSCFSLYLLFCFCWFCFPFLLFRLSNYLFLTCTIPAINIITFDLYRVSGLFLLGLSFQVICFWTVLYQN